MTTRSELKFHGAAEHVEVRVRVAVVVPPAPDTRFGSDDAYPSIVRSERLLPDQPGRRRSGRNRSLRGADRSWPCGIHVHLRSAARGYVEYPDSGARGARATDREVGVVAAVLVAGSAKAAAHRLGLSRCTAKSALKRIATSTSNGSSVSWNPRKKPAAVTPEQALCLCTGPVVPVSDRWITR
jgi:hypothetical protein